MVKFHFDCVFYYVSDLEESIPFYRDTLGLQLISRDVVARFDIDGVLFELVPAVEKSKLEGKGNARLCLEVNNIRDAVEQLRAAGIPTSAVQQVANGALTAFQDPDGNELVLWQYR